MEDLTMLCALTGAAGVGTHLLYFIRGEHEQNAHRWITRALTGVGALAVSVMIKTRFKILESIVLTTLLSISYFVGLYGSIVLYRTLFHPLRKFPGPFWCKFSNLYHAYMIRKSDNYLWIRKLHEQYGPIVRTGPNNLSVNDPSAIQIVLSNESKCKKTSWYDRSLPLVNLHTCRDKKAHDARRRVFSKAFTPTALRDYEERVVVHCDEWIRQMDKISGKPFDASAWLKYFAFDVMGDLGLGKSFNMMTSEQNRWIPDLLETSMAPVGPTSPISWTAPILHRLPKAGNGTRKWLEFVGSQVQERLKKISDRSDILTHLVNAYEESPKRDIDYQWLRGDTRLTIVGGSDTTAATLTFLFYHLAKDPSQMEKLRAELEPLVDENGRLNPKEVSKAKHLEGVIQESLRLHPAIPSGFPRLTPPEGIIVNGTFIPGGVIVVIPVYAMQHDEANYVNADEFIPERWYTKPELIKNKSAFLTWNVGMNGCIGRALALAEMRDLVTQFVHHFESVKFAPGEDGSNLVTATKDHFTVGVQPLKLIFEKKQTKA